jgi:CheY-like chemotaxis protein
MATPRHRVLLVENEPAVRAAMLGALGTAGLEAVGAADAAQALDVPAHRRIAWWWPTITCRSVLQGILQNPDRWPTRSAVMADRRHRERRLRMRQGRSTAAESSAARSRTPMWYTHGFIVVETPAIPTEAIQLTTSPA